MGGRKSPSPIDKAHGLFSSLYYRTSRDVGAAFRSTVISWFILYTTAFKDRIVYFLPFLTYQSFYEKNVVFITTAKLIVGSHVVLENVKRANVTLFVRDKTRNTGNFCKTPAL